MLVSNATNATDKYRAKPYEFTNSCLSRSAPLTQSSVQICSGSLGCGDLPLPKLPHEI
jgi:hypothetical protein